jgi:hypothetical protein
MQSDLAASRRAPMLEQINPLPCPQGELALQDRNCELHAGQRRADVRRHVIGAFIPVPISPRFLRRHAVEIRLQISAYVRRGVLLNEQSGGGVPTKQGQKPRLHLMRLEPISDIAGNLDEPAATGRNRKDIDELAHFDICRHWRNRSIGNTVVILALLRRPRERLIQAEAKMRLIILIILIILIVGAVPAWPYSTGWGYYPAGGLGTILIILLILALLGYV